MTRSLLPFRYLFLSVCFFWFILSGLSIWLLCVLGCKFFFFSICILFEDYWVSWVYAFIIFIVFGEQSLFFQVCFPFLSLISFWYVFLILGIVSQPLLFIPLKVFCLCASFWVSISGPSISLVFSSVWLLGKRGIAFGFCDAREDSNAICKWTGTPDRICPPFWKPDW